MSEKVTRPWLALVSMIVGFFMVLVDTTIVNLANPSIMAAFHTDVNTVVWVTSAYLLAYATLLLLAGRLGDRFGPRTIYLLGLVVFTLASLGAAFSTTIGMLTAVRAVQGVGAALITPQSMAIITRTFPTDKRGSAMGVWGSAAGLAALVGPILGGFLVTVLGWQWIFLINVPVGIAGFAMAYKYVPHLDKGTARFDILGIVLSGLGLLILVLGIQEGPSYNWGRITGILNIPLVITVGTLLLAAFVLWQVRRAQNALLPLSIFRDRNFTLASIAVSAVGASIVAMSVPIAFYYQIGRGFQPLQAALMMIPLAIISGGLAPFIGRLTDRINPRIVLTCGLIVYLTGIALYALLLTPDAPVAVLLIPPAIIGLGTSAIWSPLSVVATRNLAPHVAGAGAGAYNTIRQVGSVLGSAAIGALIQSLLITNLGTSAATGTSYSSALPDSIRVEFATAMSQALILPVCTALLAVITVLFLTSPRPRTNTPSPTKSASQTTPASKEE